MITWVCRRHTPAHVGPVIPLTSLRRHIYLGIAEEGELLVSLAEYREGIKRQVCFRAYHCKEFISRSTSQNVESFGQRTSEPDSPMAA